MLNQNIKWSSIVIPEKAQHGSGFLAYRLNSAAFNGVLNPVLNVDHYFMSEPTFPEHPHAGFSAITYMFEDSENSILNRDSLGNEININPGDLHWAQAGTGMLHEEPPLINGRVSHGLQIFINLPQKLRKSEPKVYHLANSEAPRITTAGDVAQVKVVTGQFGNNFSPVQTDWPTDLLQLKWLKKGDVQIELHPGQTALILNLSENVKVNDDQQSSLPKFTGVAASNKRTTPQNLVITGSEKSDVVIIRSHVIDDPTIFHGPFVGSNPEEINQIISRYRRGEFGKINFNQNTRGI